MIFYISSPNLSQIILSSCTETDELIVDSIVGQRICFLKYIKNNIALMSDVDKFLIDLSALEDEDKDIVEAIKMFRTINDKVQIIIVSPNRVAGDELLSELFSLGIMDIVATSDYLEIKEAILISLTEGKKFADAVKFKDIRKIDGIVTYKERKLVDKVKIGISTANKRAGATHNSIILAATLRKKGYIVALVECNNSGAYLQIKEEFNQKLYDNSYFVMDNIDYYPNMTAKSFEQILNSKNYNFIIYDYGYYKTCDSLSFHESHVQAIITGSKAWEIPEFISLISELNKDLVKHINYLFNFTAKKYEKDIRKSLRSHDGEAYKVYLLDYTSDPFNTYEFLEVEELLKDYLPNIQPNKKGLISFLKRIKN